MPALRIKLPNLGETTHLFRGGRVTVGRAPDNTIQITHASISSHHAEFVAVEGGYRLHDLRSTNRSYVEGEPITERTLRASCTILFGSVECEFDAAASVPPKRPALPPRAHPEPRPETTFLENENHDLRQHIHALQRRFEILGNARLVTSKADLTPYAATGDALKSLSGECTELRQQNASLRLQVEHLREGLALTTRERDAARQAAEALQTEHTLLRLELKQAQLEARKLAASLPAAPRPVAPPPKPPTGAPVSPPPRPAGAAPRPTELPPPDAALLPAQVRTLREVAAQLATAPAEAALLRRAGEVIAEVRRNASALDRHAFYRITRDLHEAITALGHQGQPPSATTVRTIRQAAEFLARLLEPRLFATGHDLPPGQVLAIDDDADLLATVTTALTAAGLQVAGCASAEEAMIAVAAQRFDTIIADVRLPGMDGTAFCAHARDLPAYRRTPIVFLTVADSLDQRAATSLSGGSEFIAKPFNVAELVVKVETWVLKHQLQLL